MRKGPFALPQRALFSKMCIRLVVKVYDEQNWRKYLVHSLNMESGFLNACCTDLPVRDVRVDLGMDEKYVGHDGARLFALEEGQLRKSK